MSATTQEQLHRFFQEAAGVSASGGATTESATASSGIGTDSEGGQGYAATTVGTSTRGGAEAEQSSSGGGSTVESALTTFLAGGLGIVPLVSSLFGLFGGGDSAPPQLEKYEMPSSIDFMSADTSTGLAAANYDEFGMPRLADTAFSGQTAGAAAGAGDSSQRIPSGTGSQTGAATPQINVSVQAMDAQSILDRSGDIAQAVRSAMLNMSAINDVISDL